mgnify:CR=1 FL=1
MTQGYITLGVDQPGKVDNIEAAAILAMTARMADPDREFAVAVRSHGDVPSRLENAFDYIIELPFKRTDPNEENQLIDTWQIYYATPFDETVWINPRSLVIDNLATIWEGTEHVDMLFGNSVTYRGDNAQYRTKLHPLMKNNLPTVTADVFYFGDNNDSAEFFKMADPVFRNWRDIYRQYIKEHRPNMFDFTVLVNIVTHMIGIEVHDHRFGFEYIDFNPDNMPIDLDEESTADWSEQINIWFYKGQHVKVNNHRQKGIWVYHDDDILTKEVKHDIRINFSQDTTTSAA